MKLLLLHKFTQYDFYHFTPDMKLEGAKFVIFGEHFNIHRKNSASGTKVKLKLL